MLAVSDLVALIDLTCLDPLATQGYIEAMCAQAESALGSVAAVCVFPKWLTLVKTLLAGTSVALCCVVNFPRPILSLEAVTQEIERLVALGVDEIDVVMPYRMLGNDEEGLTRFLAACRVSAQERVLKVIMESFLLTESEVELATDLIVASGADFVKTSTGKYGGATYAAVDIILTRLIEASSVCGLKISGGVARRAEADIFCGFVNSALGADACCAKRLRFGTSRLLASLVAMEL